MRVELSKASRKCDVPDAFEAFAADLAFGDQFLVELHPGDHVNVDAESRKALHVAQAMIAQWRIDHNLPAVTAADHEKKYRGSESSDD
jgi:hypothetical protein